MTRIFWVFMIGMAACAGRTPSTEHPNRAVIMEAELPAGGTESVYDVVQRLRPEYLRHRPQGSATAIAVFTGGQLLGDVTELRRIPVTSVKEIRYYSVEQAKNRFGMQYSGGIIEFTYR